MSWAQALGGLASSFTGSFSSGTSLKNSKALMEYQDQLARQTFQWKNENGWNFMRKGLVDADYNPILAIGQSPIDAALPNATAQGASMSIDGASSTQANVAKKMSDSQIQLNKATANKVAEEALSESNRRHMMDSQTALNNMLRISENAQLPYKTRKLAGEISVLESQRQLNNANAAAAPRLAGAAEKQAAAAEKTANTNATWTPIGVGSGIAAGLIGYGVRKAKSIFKRPVGFR